MIHKKSQIKNLETIMVIFVFTFLLLFAYVFYVRSQYASINEDVRRLTQLKVVGLSQVISMPEFRCNDYTTKNCLDYYKLKAFSELMSGNDDTSKRFNLYYAEKFGFSKIIVKEIYPSEEEIVLYDKTPKDYKAVYSSELPVSVYDTTTGRYSFGTLIIKVYS